MFEREEGKLPKEKDFTNNPKYPSYNLYKSRFGSWNNAIRETGLIPGQYTSDDKLLESLRTFEREERRLPKEKDFTNNSKYPGFTTIIRRFGGWNNASRLAKLVTISGQVVIASVSGNVVNISGQSVVTSISGQAVTTSVSGNVVQISGQSVTISGNATVEDKLDATIADLDVIKTKLNIII